ncbi:holin family protein [Paenibacillus sp. NPDC058174]|uniref:phage holin family protein n=1 Tax=Paenibacillus sp. NPDC058174 TaxID=3346366 RepID=UPI0036DFA3D2
MIWSNIKLAISMYEVNTYIRFLTIKELSVYGSIALIGGYIAQLFGGWSPLFTLFCILIGADYITGILASLKEQKGIKSALSFWGLMKKGLMLLSILIAHHIDLALSMNGVMIGSIWFWVANEVISLTENYARLGLPMPDVIKDKISIFKGKALENKDQNNENT